MPYSHFLPPDLLPTYWRVSGSQKIVVTLWKKWPYAVPTEDQMLNTDEVHAYIRTPSTPWVREISDNHEFKFARGSDLTPQAAGHLFRDMGKVTLDFPNGFRPRENWSVNVLHTGFLSHGIERFLDTMNSKMTRKHASAVHGRQQVLLLAARFGADSLDDPDVWKLFCFGRFGCITNMDVGADLPPEDGPETSRTLLPTLRIEGPETIASGATADFAVSLIDPKTGGPYPSVPRQVEVHLEATAGYIPRRREMTVDGVARCSLMALGLNPGDKIKLKAGFWNFTGADEKIIEVS
jgi:hypothetical protein